MDIPFKLGHPQRKNEQLGVAFVLDSANRTQSRTILSAKTSLYRVYIHRAD